MIPSGYKEDVVYSAIPTNGSGDLSFTRASNGTRVNSAGLVEVVPWNLFINSENFSVWNAQGSSVTLNSTTAPNGTLTASTIIESNTTDEHNRYLEPSIGGGEFTYSIYLKRFNTDWSALYIFNTVVGGVRYWVNLSTLTAGTSANIGSGIGTTSMSLESVGNGWVRASISFTNPSGACRFYVANAQSNGGASSYAGNGTNGLYAWGAQVNVGSTAKPYFPTTDRLNVPRLTYQNGGGGCPSLLLEKQSTNLVTYSEQFDNAAWSKSGATVTANDAISPDGTQNADKIVFSGADKQIFQTFNVTNHTLSIYIKGTAGETIVIGFGAGADITHTLTGGFDRVSVTGTSIFFVFIGTFNGATARTIYLWGAQLENSSYPTSYIPTTSSSATRVADACQLSMGTLLAQSNWTIFFDHKIVGGEGGSAPIYSLYESGNDNVFLYVNGNAGLNLYMPLQGGYVFGTGNNNGFVPNQRSKVLLKYNGTTIKYYINGVLYGSASASLTYTQRALWYETSGGKSFQVNETVFFPTALSDADAIALTTI